VRYTTLPIEVCAFSTVMARVTVRLVIIDQRKYPERYQYPPEGVRRLAVWCRENHMYELQPWLLSLAKELASGYTLGTWRDAVQSHHYAPRRLDKVPLPSRSTQ